MDDNNGNNCILGSWTPHTTQVLQRGGSTAWDVLDHIIENDDDDTSSFVDALREELESSGLLHELRPARTVADGKQQENKNASLLLEALGSIRGDVSTFVSREYRQQADFPIQHRHLSRLIQSVETTAIHHLSKSNIVSIDPSFTSVQLALYPGDGKSGYVRHCDRGSQFNNYCQEEETDNNNNDGTNSKPQRAVTAVYYATPSNWNSKLDDGSLRLYHNGDEYYSVVPYPNRLVVFRSDGVSHEVIPSLRQDRMAITVWLYGWINKPKAENQQHARLLAVPPFLPSAPSFSLLTNDTNKVKDGPPPLPISTRASDIEGKTIFVSIASYCDSELIPTMTSLFETARHPESVHVGVVWQVDTTTTPDDLQSYYNFPRDKWWFAPERIRFLTMDAQHAQGPCYARFLCQSLWRGEDYVLQIDSHMRFRENWDAFLMQKLQSLHNDRVMLTSYPVGYQLPDNVPNETRGTLLVPWKFEEKDGMLRQRGRLLVQQEGEKCIPCLLYAAGFNFATAKVLQDCPYDGNLKHLFFGEEISMALRLYTHGYDLYAPSQSVCYHLWSRQHRSKVKTVVTKEEERLKQTSLDVVKNQLLGRNDSGLGTVRTVHAFCIALGVDFATRSVQPDAQYGSLTPNAFGSSDEPSMDASVIQEFLFPSAIPADQAQQEGNTQEETRLSTTTLDPEAQALIASFLGI